MARSGATSWFSRAEAARVTDGLLEPGDIRVEGELISRFVPLEDRLACPPDFEVARVTDGLLEPGDIRVEGELISRFVPLEGAHMTCGPCPESQRSQDMSHRTLTRRSAS